MICTIYYNVYNTGNITEIQKKIKGTRSVIVVGRRRQILGKDELKLIRTAIGSTRYARSQLATETTHPGPKSLQSKYLDHN